MLPFDQIKDVLVVNKVNVRPVYFFFDVFVLFHFEHMLVEMLLQFFVGKVDAELLKAVLFEALEAIDI